MYLKINVKNKKKKKKEQDVTVETVENRSNAKRPWHIDATFKPKTHFSKLKTASLKEDKVVENEDLFRTSIRPSIVIERKWLLFPLHIKIPITDGRMNEIIKYINLYIYVRTH